MVYRVFVEKKAGLDNEAQGLLSEARNLLSIASLENLRLVKARAERLPNLHKLEFLPFHKLCLEKYERLGIEFPLRDTPAMNEAWLKQLLEKL